MNEQICKQAGSAVSKAIAAGKVNLNSLKLTLKIM
jgi:hypothetical protein